MWSATWDEESKAVYYWNSETDETTWERPEGVEISGEDSLPGQSHSQRDDGPDDGEAAPGTAGDNADEAQRLRDYYNSKEYAEWYYAAYGGPKASGDAATGATTTAKSLHGHQFAGAWNPMTAAGDGEALDSAWQNDYTSTARFNARTGRFTAATAPGASHFDPTSKAERQMSAFFDIKAYQEEMNTYKQAEVAAKKKPPKLTKKELEKFKERNKLRKKERLLKRLGDD